MDVSGLIAICRRRIDDTVEPYLISDEEFTQFANTAQREVCERGHELFDETSAVTSVAVTAGEPTYTVSDAIIVIERAQVVGEPLRMTKILREDLDINRYNWGSTSGTPTHFYQFGNTIRLYPTPDVDYTLHMSVYRYPLDDLESTSDEPELPVAEQVYLTHWMCWEAARKWDVEASNMDMAANELRLFEQRFGRSRTALEMRSWRDLPRDTSVRMRRL